MREINVAVIREKIAELCVSSNLCLPDDIKKAMENAEINETSPLCKSVLSDCIKNTTYALKYNIPICQDTGMAVVFLDIGQDIHFFGGDLKNAVNEGVADGYKKGKLRLSIVKDPFLRENTCNNTPAIIHINITSGDKVFVKVAPKGFGSENMSAIKMFEPTAEKEDIINFVTETVIKAGGNPCPPIITGIGIGGDFEYSAYLSKKALCRSVDIRNPSPFYSELEAQILREINETGIGAQGFGGSITALAVNIEEYPTHIAGLPVAVNIGCHVTRHAEAVI